ncbi:MAG: radical SAM protein [archaeon]
MRTCDRHDTMKLRIAVVLDEIGNFEHFSIPLLSALAKRDGHSVRLIVFGPNPAKAIGNVVSGKPDIVFYSVTSSDAQRYLTINRTLKKHAGFFSVFGGAHPTFFPSFVREKGVDAICRGESDLALPVFLKEFGRESMYKTSNFSFKKGDAIIENPLTDLIADLDTLPFPDRNIIYSQSRFLADNPIKMFMAGRGCPYSCSYCFNHAYNSMYSGKGKILRKKSVTYLINEIKDVKEKYPLTFIKFHDDIFGADPEWLAEFAERFPKEVGVPFLAYARPNMLSPEYCRKLKKAGCHSVCLAIECGNNRIRNLILNRNMTNEQIITGCKNLKEAGLKVYALNMVGLPSETIDDIFSTIRLNQKARVDFADVSIFQPYPGTRIAQYCRDHGYLNEGDERYESQFSRSLLNLGDEFKDKVYIVHKLFALMIIHPRSKMMLPFLFWIRKAPLLKPALNCFFRAYYGYQVHKRIFNSVMPFRLRVRGAIILLLSRNRS